MPDSTQFTFAATTPLVHQARRRHQQTTLLLRGSPITDPQSAGAGAGDAVAPRDRATGSQSLVTPVPERLWAIRNVANSLARFGEGGEGQVSGRTGLGMYFDFPRSSCESSTQKEQRRLDTAAGQALSCIHAASRVTDTFTASTIHCAADRLLMSTRLASCSSVMLCVPIRYAHVVCRCVSFLIASLLGPVYDYHF